MNPIYKANLIGLYTILHKELTRILRIWSQTLLPPAITTTLYFLIFGKLIGSRIGLIDGVSYIAFIVPGLIMMSVITSAYTNVSSSFYSLKFQHSIDELLVSPLPESILLLGFIAGGIVRSFLVAFIVIAVALFFTHVSIHHYGVTLLVIMFSSTFFSLLGFINGLFAKSFDDVMLIPTFLLTPLIYLGGVFYSINMLPQIWRIISLVNPILYLVNAFRFGILGVSDIPVLLALGILIVTTVFLYFLCLHLLKIGYGLRH
jgi:ABC-2 type transport system permease protein